jgi:hypothetical protein
MFKRFLLSAISCLFCSCGSVSYVFFRPEQQISHQETNVTRIYIDRFGDFYPDTAVHIDVQDFQLDGRQRDQKSASLAHYFLSRKSRLKQLRDFYGIAPHSSAKSAYREVQRLILAGYAKRIAEMMQNADKLIYLVHGFNDLLAESEYVQLRSVIAAHRYPGALKPAYVDVHWDGLNAHALDSLPVVKVWQPALLNSRFVSITLRQLITGVEERQTLPTVIITHSLGAGVALGALFDTHHKWDEIDEITPNSALKRLAVLRREATPVKPVRIGILAPAIPGERTFVDFNERKPLKIEAADNHIEKVVIGYNYNDYALTKKNPLLLDINLGRFYGSTSLGCNAIDWGKPEIDRVKEVMESNHYNENIIVPLEFHTPSRSSNPSTDEHAWRFYTTAAMIDQFLDQLFR